MKRYLTGLSASVLLGLSLGANAQDIHFSQFYENAILRNPALTGIFSGDYKVGIDYRSQWGSISVPYTTTMISGETRVLVNREIGDYVSFGLVGTYDKAGSIDFTSIQLYPSVSYNKALEDQHNSYLSVGFAAGYLHRSVDQSKMTTTGQWINGQYLPGNPTGEIFPFKSSNNYDLGAGVSLNSSVDQNGIFNYYLGAGVYHLNAPTETFNDGSDVLVKLPMKWEFNAGFHSSFSQQWGLTVHANYSLMKPYSEALLGGMLTYRNVPVGLPSIFAFSFGCFYRFKDAIIPTVKIEYKNTSIGISYDATQSTLVTSPAASSAGATEISLYIRGNYNHKKNPRDPIMCPRFEDLNNYNFR